MLAPAKQVVLTNTKNKVQLNAMLAEGLLDSDYYTNASPNHTLTIAGISDVPVATASPSKFHRGIFKRMSSMNI